MLAHTRRCKFLARRVYRVSKETRNSDLGHGGSAPVLLRYNPARNSARARARAKTISLEGSPNRERRYLAGDEMDRRPKWLLW